MTQWPLTPPMDLGEILTLLILVKACAQFHKAQLRSADLSLMNILRRAARLDALVMSRLRISPAQTKLCSFPIVRCEVTNLCREQEKTKRKIKAKAAKRAKLNPDTAQTALDVQQNGFLRAGAEPESTANDEAEPSSAQLSEQKQERPKPLQAKALHLSTSTGKSALKAYPTLSSLIFAKSF